MLKWQHIIGGQQMVRDKPPNNRIQLTPALTRLRG